MELPKRLISLVKKTEFVNLNLLPSMIKISDCFSLQLGMTGRRGTAATVSSASQPVDDTACFNMRQIDDIATYDNDKNR